MDQLLILYVIRVVFNLDCWFRVSSGAADLEDWERDLVRDVERIFSPYEQWQMSGRPITYFICDVEIKSRRNRVAMELTFLILMERVQGERQ